MTCIIEGVRTKKDLRARCQAGDTKGIYINDPSIFAPRFFALGEMKIGQREVVTNHPKRSWFAMIQRVDEDSWRVE